MKKTILEIYALAICFVGVLSLTVISCVGIYSVVGFVAPEFTIMRYDYQLHQTNNEFTEGWGAEKKEQHSEEEITQLRKESYQETLKGERREAKQSLAVAFLVAVINAGVFISHWSIAKRARMSGDST